MSNSLDPDPALHFVRRNLGLTCLQRLSVDGTIRLRVKTPEKSVITKCEIFVKNADRGTADADVVSMSFAG